MHRNAISCTLLCVCPLCDINYSTVCITWLHISTVLPVKLVIKMSQCEHTHLAHYKHFCFYCKFKFYYPEILRVVACVDTQKIKLLKQSWASRFLLHNNYKLFCFYYKFIFCFPMSLRVLLILKNKATKSQLRTSVKSLDTRWCCWCCYSKNKATRAQLSLA